LIGSEGGVRHDSDVRGVDRVLQDGFDLRSIRLQM
jgi:hypothetical protein